MRVGFRTPKKTQIMSKLLNLLALATVAFGQMTWKDCSGTNAEGEITSVVTDIMPVKGNLCVHCL
jgi:hypothetical protein